MINARNQKESMQDDARPKKRKHTVDAPGIVSSRWLQSTTLRRDFLVDPPSSPSAPSPQRKDGASFQVPSAFPSAQKGPPHSTWWPFRKAEKYVFVKPARTPGTPTIRPEMGAPGPPDIVGLSSEIVGFRNRGGGPVGHPQGVQVKTIYSQYKMPRAPSLKSICEQLVAALFLMRCLTNA